MAPRSGRLFEDSPIGDERSGSADARPAGDSPSSIDGSAADAPLADRLRPRDLDELVGQEHLVGEDRILSRVLAGGDPPSMIFWGPPGVGKTTLARIIARVSEARFVELSATQSGVKDVREAASEARHHRRLGSRTILFIDEVHRFNKAQQDALLPHVEGGDLVLIGATTENPSFEVVAPLLSRCKVLTLEPLDEEELMVLLRRALETPSPRGLGHRGLLVDEEELRALARFADGDARVALNTLEVAARIAEGRPREEGADGADADDADAAAGVRIDGKAIAEAAQARNLRYDRAGEEHFNQISALHKSVRNSDPDAAVYWLARMLESGEDPVYVGRRLLRMASEDVGLADPDALPVAVAAFDAVQAIGMPEAALALVQATVYLATAPKSNSLEVAYQEAVADVKERGNLPVPLRLRNAPTRLMRELEYGRGYRYAHDLDEGVADMECLPEELVGRRYYRPGSRGEEVEIARRLRRWAEARAGQADEDEGE